jgi:hypothetical protein
LTGVISSGRCEKIDFKICSELGVKKIALGCRISDRWRVGKHLGSKIKSRKLKQINFFTSSCPGSLRSGHWRLLFRNHNQEVEDLAAARRAHGIPDDEFVAATMGEEFSLPCPLDALF